MKRLVIAALLGLSPIQSYALDLTPQRLLLQGDGPPRERHFFQGEGKRLAFRMDGKMSVTGSGDMAIFRFEDLPSASMRLYKSPSKVEVPFKAQGPDSYEAVARRLLPPEAAKVLLTGTKPDAISINGWSSVQFVFTYEFYGLSFRQAITFLNFNPREQFVFQVRARQENYDKIYSRSYRVLNSLFELPLVNNPGPS